MYACPDGWWVRISIIAHCKNTYMIINSLLRLFEMSPPHTHTHLVPQRRYAIWNDTIKLLHAVTAWFSLNKQRWCRGEPSLRPYCWICLKIARDKASLLAVLHVPSDVGGLIHGKSCNLHQALIPLPGVVAAALSPGCSPLGARRTGGPSLGRRVMARGIEVQPLC